MKRSLSKVNTDDKYRVILTETLPYELPLIFDNKGLYDFYKEYEGKIGSLPELLSKALIPEINTTSIPYMFQISKGYESYRELYLVHPSNQRMIVKFYDKYRDLILFYVNKSRFSLRYPKKVTSSVYKNKGKEEFYNLLAHDGVDVAGNDIYQRLSSTYFAYKKFNLLYKFFESTDYLRLERKFRFMTSVDVSRCFDSIYTHSISWAVKEKNYIKKNLFSVKGFSGFDAEFDFVIRSGNDNETNGIVIGPEYSRIFSEIIFQDIDMNIYHELSLKGLVSGVDYAIKRYVDDFYIFSKTNDVGELIFEEVVRQLWKYKLRINESKTKKSERPFVTARSKGIIDLRFKISDLLNNSIQEITISDGSNIIKPKPIRNYYALSNLYIKNIKSSWFSTEKSDGSFSGYVISSLLNKLEKVIKGYLKYFDNSNSQDIDKATYEDDVLNWMLMTIEVSSYCYLLSPTVSESFKLSQILVQIHRFVQLNYPDSLDVIEHKIFEVVNHLLQDDLNSDKACGVETLNLLIVLSRVSSLYQVKERDLIKVIYGSNSNPGYFSIISALFVSENDSNFCKLIELTIKNAKSIISTKVDIKKSSEALHLYLDLMTCPLIDDDSKKDLTKSVLVGAGMSAEKKDVKKLFEFSSKRVWFVNWNDIDLVRTLQRKLLKKVY